MSEELRHFLQHLLEFAVLLPAGFFAFMPVEDKLRYSDRKTDLLTGTLLIVFAVTGSWVCMRYGLTTNTVLVPGMVVLFAVYCRLVTVGFGQKMFCFANAAMISAFAAAYTGYLTAPMELKEPYELAFSFRAGLISFLLNILLGIAFSRTLRVKMPRILRDERLEGMWQWLPMIPVIMTSILFWAEPMDLDLVMSGRVREITLVMLALIPIVMFVLYHVFWQTFILLTESETLARQNTFFQVERRRYDALRKLIDDTRTIRHDFRQHLRVISQLAQEGDVEELREYIAPLAESVEAVKRYSKNIAVDAIASYYAEQAEKSQTQIIWKINLPEELPMEEAEYCPLLGNLVENALAAVSSLPPEQRKVKVVTGIPSENFLGITVENPYEGTIQLKSDGLPKTSRKGHGVGLESVANTVERHNGFMEVKTDDHIFAVNILLNCDRAIDKDE